MQKPKLCRMELRQPCLKTTTSVNTLLQFQIKSARYSSVHSWVPDRKIVMDPVSILTTVSAVSRTALALSSTLYTFVQATKGVDGTVRSLYDEVTGLNFTLDAILGIAKSTEIDKTRDNEQSLKLWSTVTKSLVGCRETVDKLHETLRGLDRESSSVARQAIRTLKLNWKTDQINALRSHLHSHNSTLQLSMQILNVHFTSIGPRLIVDDLVPRIEILMDMVLHYSEAQRGSASSVPLQVGAKPSPTSGASNAENLVASAKEVLLEAKSVVARSERGSVYPSTAASVIQRLEDLEHDFDDSMTAIRGNVPVRRDSKIEPDPHARIKRWIPTIPSRGLDGTESSETESIHAPTMMTPSESTFEMPADEAETVLFDYDESDDDNVVDYMVLEACISRALTAYKSGEWATAEPLLKRVVDDSITLPAEKLLSAGIDSTQIKFRLAICILQQDKIDEATPSLLRLITSKGPPDEEKSVTMQRLALIYLYAEVCFCKKKTEEARKHCRKALSLERKLFGNEVRFLDHNAFDLLSRIAQIQGDNLAAELFLEKSEEAQLFQEEEKKYPELQMARLHEILILKSRQSLYTDDNTQLNTSPKNFKELTTLDAWGANNRSLPKGTLIAALFLQQNSVPNPAAIHFSTQLVASFKNHCRKFPNTPFIYYNQINYSNPTTIALCRTSINGAAPSVEAGAISRSGDGWSPPGDPMVTLSATLKRHGCT